GFWWQTLSASADGKRMVLAHTREEADVYVGELHEDGRRLTQPRRLTLDDRRQVRPVRLGSQRLPRPLQTRGRRSFRRVDFWRTGYGIGSDHGAPRSGGP